MVTVLSYGGQMARVHLVGHASSREHYTTTVMHPGYDRSHHNVIRFMDDEPSKVPRSLSLFLGLSRSRSRWFLVLARVGTSQSKVESGGVSKQKWNLS